MTQDAIRGAEPRGRYAFLALLCLGVVLSMVTWFSATAVTPELIIAWELSGSEAAWLTNGVQLGFVAGALGASLINLPDIVRLKYLMASAALAAGVVNAILLLEPNIVGAVACRFLTGVALAAIYPPAMKLVATWFQKGRGMALGAVVGALTLGSAMPHLFRALVEHLDWKLVILLSSGAALIAAAIFGRAAKEGPYAFGQAVFNPRQIGLVWRDRNLMWVNIGYFGHMWELYAMWAWVLVFFRLAMDGVIDGAYASLIVFGIIASGCAGCLLGGVLSDRVGRTVTTAGFMLISATCAILIGFAFEGPFALLVGIGLIWGISIVGDSPIFSTAVTELAPRELVGTALSFQMGIGFGLTVLVIWMMPQLADLLGGWQWTFLALAPGPLVGAYAMLKLRTLPAASRLANGKR